MIFNFKKTKNKEKIYKNKNKKKNTCFTGLKNIQTINIM